MIKLSLIIQGVVQDQQHVHHFEASLRNAESQQPPDLLNENEHFQAALQVIHMDTKIWPVVA